MKISIELSGGAELLFDGVKKHAVDLPDHQKSWKIKDLLPWMKDNMLKSRPDLFLQDNTVRPGILVLINDTDWELMDRHDYEIQENDTIIFISTLHGG